MLGPGVQTAKRIIQWGLIGRPLFASTVLQWQGPELFHPNPAFLHAKGAGPLLDMGPYYISALVHVFGPVDSVAALGLQGSPSRRVRVRDLAGREFPVEIPSTVSVIMSFEQGGQARSLYSTDSPLLRQGILEIAGTEGTLVIPDPNYFGGKIAITRPIAELPSGSDPVVQEVIDVTQEGVMAGRGLGVLDMARALRTDAPHVADGVLGYHALDTLLSIEESVESRCFVNDQSSVGQVGSIPAEFDPAT